MFKYIKKVVSHELTFFSGVNYYALFILSLAGFFILKFLGPELYGVWNVLSILLYSVKFCSFGAIEGMVRQVPFYHGAGDNQRAVQIQQATLTWGVFVAFLVCGVLCVFPHLYNSSILSFYSDELFLAGFAFLSSYIYYFVKKRFESDNNFLLVSKYFFISSSLATFLALGLVYFLQVKALLVSVIIRNVLVVTYLLYKRVCTFRFQLRKDAFFEVIRVGFPIMVLFLSAYLMTRIDSLIVFFFLGHESAGWYGAASYISIIILYFPECMTVVLFPKAMRTFGAKKTKKSIMDFYLVPLEFLAWGLPVCLSLIFFAVKIPISSLLLEYLPSLPVSRILIMSTFFSSLVFFTNSYLIVLNKQKTFMWYNAVILVFGCFADIFAVEHGFGMQGVAWATGLVFFVTSIIWVGHILFDFTKDGYVFIRRILLVYIPFFYVLSVTVLIEKLIRFESLLVDVLSKGLLSILFCLPVIIGFINIFCRKRDVFFCFFKRSEKDFDVCDQVSGN